MLALDTNILVRLVTNDEPAAARRIQVSLDAELSAGRDCLVGAQMQALGGDVVLTLDKAACKAVTHRLV